MNQLENEMNKSKSAKETEDVWESGQLGASAEHVAVAPAELEAAIDAALGLKAISIRLPTQLVESYRLIAAHHGIGYQPLMRDILQRWVKEGLKEVLDHQTKKSDEADVRIEGMKKAA